MSQPQILSPAGYEVSNAMAYADIDGTARLVSAANPLPIAVTSAAPLPVSFSNTAIAISGSLPAGSNALGSVSVTNLPATQAVTGTVSVAALPALPAGTNTIGAIANAAFAITGSLPAGSNALGSVTVANLPARQSVLTVQDIAATGSVLSGTQSTSGTVGPFTPQINRPIWLTLSGSWSGNAQLLRSTDGGVTRLPLTVGGIAWGNFTANCNEPAANPSDAAETYYVQFALSAGAATYRLAQ